MSLISSVKLYLPLGHTEQLLDSVTGNSFSTLYSTNSTVDIYTDSMGGYQMKQDQYLAGMYWPLSISNGLSLGFWLAPYNMGVARNVDNLEPMKVSLMSFGYGDIDPYSDQGFVPLDDVFVLYEESLVNGKNRMVVAMEDLTTGLPYTATTGEYDPQEWHAFWIIWDGSSPSIDIYIDGSLQTLASVSGDIPTA